jgi:hypothetical protein
MKEKGSGIRNLAWILYKSGPYFSKVSKIKLYTQNPIWGRSDYLLLGLKSDMTINGYRVVYLCLRFCMEFYEFSKYLKKQ